MALVEITTNTTELESRLESHETQIGDNRAAIDDNAARITAANQDITAILAQLATVQQALINHDARIAALETSPPIVGIPAGLRGVWLQMWQTNDESIQQAADFGANAVFIFTGTGRSVTFANSAGIPRSTDNRIEVVLEAAQYLGLDVYAALTTGYFWRDAYPDQCISHTLGIDTSPFADWLDYRNAGARELIATLATDLAKYPIKGICLDYTRWARQWYPGSGLTPDAINQTVALCKQRLGNSVTLCASPISIWDDPTYGALPAYGQDWHTWLNAGSVDWLTPMVYSGQSFLDARLREWQTLGYWPAKATPVLSPCTNGNSTTPKTDDAWRTEIRTVQDAGARGFTVFDLSILMAQPSKASILREMWRSPADSIGGNDGACRL